MSWLIKMYGAKYPQDVFCYVYAKVNNPERRNSTETLIETAVFDKRLTII